MASPKSYDDKEETFIRVARIHRTATLAHVVASKNVDNIVAGEDSDLLSSIANSLAFYFEKDLDSLLKHNPADLVFRLLACGMGLEKMVSDNHPRIKELRKEIESLPYLFVELMEAVNNFSKDTTDEEMKRLSNSPHVKKIYKKMEQEISDLT